MDIIKHSPEWFKETLAILHSKNPQQAIKDDNLNMLLSMPPHIDWIKKHPIHGTMYIPTAIIRRNLKVIFGQFHDEILREGQMFQSMYSVVRLHILNPATGEWFFYDGIGACDVQTNTGASAADLSAIKAFAVQKGLPASATYAFKNAAAKLGPMFGSELNKKFTAPFNPVDKMPPPSYLQEPGPVAPAPTPVAIPDFQLDF